LGRLEEREKHDGGTSTLHTISPLSFPPSLPQVRNLRSCIKVAVDFVSPPALEQTLSIVEALRACPRNPQEGPSSSLYQDKLQARGGDEGGHWG
jgi:hypothetical protein